MVTVAMAPVEIARGGGGGDGGGDGDMATRE